MALVVISWIGLSLLICLALLKAAAGCRPRTEEHIIHRHIPASQIESLIAAEAPAKAKHTSAALESPLSIH